MNVSVTNASVSGGITSGQSGSIDKQIQMLMKRKTVLFQRLNDIVNGEDDVKVKEEKVKAIRMEINLIDLQIQQLIQRKAELEKEGKSTAHAAADKLPPSPSELLAPERVKSEERFLDIRM